VPTWDVGFRLYLANIGFAVEFLAYTPVTGYSSGMGGIILLVLATVRDTARSRVALQLERLVLRRQCAIMERKPLRPSLRSVDRVF
jgi:hypothetical protein